jgi:enoyl-CoA hydratase
MSSTQTSNETTYRTIRVEREDSVATVFLNKPPLNIIDIEMMKELLAALRKIDEEDDVRVIVFRAAGEKGFSAGVSIQDHLPDRIVEMIQSFHAVFRHLARTQKVTIAAVHGVCLGGGFELALICDMIVASDDAKFGQPEIKLGQLPPVGIVLLPHLVGYRKAAELVLSGNTIGPAEALALGIVNRVVPKVQLSESLSELVQSLVSGSGNTLRLTKELLRRVSGIEFEKLLDESEEYFLHTLVPTADAKEGIFAFLEKRIPKWSHR